MSMSFKFRKVNPNAPAPHRSHDSDSGFDLCLVTHVKTEMGVSWYDTGIAVQPPDGYYFEVYGRSSIAKSGYMLANNVGIIDCSYRGTIQVALLKVNPNAPELTLPCRIVQIVPRRLIHLTPEESDSLDDTARGAGGFGSTGV